MPSVLLVTGPVGVGKTTVLQEAEMLLTEAGLPFAVVVLQEIARSGPCAPDDPYNERLMYRNLASLWSNYTADSRVDRLIVEKLVRGRSDLRPIYDAIPDAELTIVRLRAPLAVLEDRVRRRESCPVGELSAARWWAPRMDQWGFEDFLVEAG